MTKKEARKIFKQKRDEISATDRMKWDDLILIQFQTLDIPFIDYALSFYPIDEYKEINTFIITEYLRFQNPALHICYPKMKNNSVEMDAVVCSVDTAFEANSYGILEPLETEIAPPALIDIILIPLLAFDERGYRVGYGKGYYDRYLKECRDDCLKVGLSYFEAVDKIDDAADYDVPLDFCITPQKVYAF